MRVRFSFALLQVTIAGLLLAGAATPARADNPPPDPRFGAVESFRDPQAAVEAGVGWERILFYWSELQPNSPDEWNGYHVPDEWLVQAASAGREVVGLLKHTPAWATDGLPGCGVPRGLDLPVDDPGNLWAAFVRRTVGMYAGRINHWIVWNEPDIAPETYGAEWCGSVEEYYRLVKVAYIAAHQVNPDVVIHLAGLTYHHDQEYLHRFLAVAAQDPSGPEHGYYFDVVSLHIYFQSESIPLIIGYARSALSAYGLTKPIWVNETNASPDSDPQWPVVRPCWRVSLEEQAGFLLQSFGLALASGAERVAVYKWRDAGEAEPFGVIRTDGSRRPAFDAYRLITTYYANTTSARVAWGDRYVVVTLEGGERTVRVVWARTQADTTVSLPAIAPQALLVDQSGGAQEITPADGRYLLTLPGARCPAEPPECGVSHPACIIGGTTYLLVEEAGAEPPPPATPTHTPTGVTPEPTHTLPPTVPPTPEPTTTPTPSSTPSPTSTATPTPSPPPTATPSPTPTPLPTNTPTPLPTPISGAEGGGSLLPPLLLLLFLLASSLLGRLVSRS